MAHAVKTVPTAAPVADFIATVADEQKRADCQAVVALMQAATGEAPVMWGSAIVGFGSYAAAYADGSSLPWPVVAFSPRKNDLTLYLMPGFEQAASTLARLGTFKTGKVCLYIKRLRDVDLAVLQELVQASVQTMAPSRVRPTQQAPTSLQKSAQKPVRKPAQKSAQKSAQKPGPL